MIIDLAGTWEYRTGGSAWLPIDLPQSWWLAGLDPMGPVEFRRPIRIPEDWAGYGVRLEFDAVDYAAAVSLDGRPVGAHVGGFAPFTVDLPAEPGEHELTVVVTVPRDEYGTAFPHTKHALRGVFGHHDARPGGWGPRGQERSSGGIWGGVRLRRLEAYGLGGLGFACTLTGADAWITVTPAVEVRGDQPRWATIGVTLTDPCDGSTWDSFTDTWLEPGRNDIEITGVVAQPHLWWTWDHGEPHRYTLTTWIDDGAGRTGLDERPVGLREIRRDSGWVWRLNGRPVFLRGSNYIGSQWLSELTPERVDGDVELAAGANLNMLRVHAHVTVPAFYDACDRAGVLVWQDLPMQWGYEDSADTYRTARQMVRELIDLHGWRPSIALWCAHNEAPWNEPWMAEEAGAFVPDQNQRLDHELAALFGRLDPSRPNLANSGNGDGHTYPGWYWGRWTDVHELPGGSMVTEYGAQAVPDAATLREFLPADATADDWAYHGFQHDENLRHVGVTYDLPLAELIERTQRYQATLVQNSTETYRRARGTRVQGVLQFMLVDPWPCVSWSVLDVHRRPKLGYDALRRAMQPILASIETGGDRFAATDQIVFGVWWVNDLPRTIRDARLSWRVVNAEGEQAHTGEVATHVLATDARRVLQAGPMRLPAGSYRIETELTGPDGTTVSTNFFGFEVTP